MSNIQVYIVGTPDAMLTTRLVKELDSLPVDVIRIAGYDINLDDKLEVFDNNKEKILAIEQPASINWTISREFLSKVKNLRSICTKSSWGQYMDIEYCNKKNIKVSNNPGANSQAVAEYAIWMMMTLLRKYALTSKHGLSDHSDPKLANYEMQGKTVGIVGLGQIGARISKLCSVLGMNVMYWSRHSRSEEYKYANLDEVLKQSDVVFNCLEICDGTMNFLNKEKLDLMKKDAYFISVMGGMGFGVEDDHYLLEKVANGTLAGFSIEGSHEPKFSLPKKIEGNVFIPPSYGYFTVEANERAYAMWKDNVLSAIRGEYKNLVS